MAITARLAIRAMLGLQLGIAAVLVGQDVLRAAPSFAWPSFAPPPSTPVKPGDQTRRFDPSKLPSRPDMPSLDMPARLFFETLPDGSTRLTGTIKQGDAARFTDWLEGQTPKPETVTLHSPGGSVEDALIIGRALRDAGINTAMSDTQVCLSACPYILMAGPTRTIAEGAMVGVHQHYYGENTVLPAFLAVEDIQQSQARVITYLDEMGIDLRVMQHALSTPPDEIYLLMPEELLRYNIQSPDKQG